ncbi:hypothetical protein [Flavobacterium johnsoniae]|uniref:Uncharacterized protein n=1 Tax=Flavobacterium johnsoniae (strain ATCC 17061 / DSM 2064 / JCM 8514 / BCRC 14874 / CCUG 350202 / NBRC 14942 / NCIMB 11054 / UW101) TaxID=376686 RepID=A5FBR8_FLAJ1|nr:hypothetical protein [Flavobacterium johnsoniae]ABQ07353.1 hypothetical protein Fjoh_4346 [Flavobacterium johnsoniae UW101]OXE99264.1 hypothetical protein B0A63_11770 [Flavobacterium johnsoniae UW101]WQG80812.1 hypothetical protein SR927_22695 [Flavobacterium johnsoniae UW101]SHL15591.1 hypothetical protein SAMN05444146_3159 [Flavobacterium johnsoniae]
MELPLALSDEILKILAQNYNKTYSLEDLTSIIMLTDNTCSEVECQAKVLDVLIQLDDDELIVLNPETDESSITKKGVIKQTIKI